MVGAAVAACVVAAVVVGAVVVTAAVVGCFLVVVGFFVVVGFVVVGLAVVVGFVVFSAFCVVVFAAVLSAVVAAVTMSAWPKLKLSDSPLLLSFLEQAAKLKHKIAVAQRADITFKFFTVLPPFFQGALQATYQLQATRH